MDKRIAALRSIVEKEIEALNLPLEPRNLYEPVHYILRLGGKRIRPILTMMGAELMGAKAEDALHQALAVEIFHNFTLVHDDIMDRADVRRGLPTVHKKWDDNIGILSGDAMMVVAYQHLAMASPEALPKLFEVFSATALLVCEGQQKDMDYAHASNVSDEEYTEMIRCKTAVLLGGAMQLGAIVAGASDANLKQIGVFAEDMGLAFQLRDDFLDTFGDAESFGKDIGGDIREGKRTWLTIKAYELGSEEDRKTLDTAFANEDLEQRIKDVMSVYDRLGIKERLQAEIERYSALSSKALDAVEGNEEVKDQLRALVAYLMGRTS